MELQTVNTIKESKFIEANTQYVTLKQLQHDHIIPVFVKDNEPVISHQDFIAVAQDVTSSVFKGEIALAPQVRVSHPVKGRIPDAKHKKAKELEEWEKTVYYERMAFLIELPEIRDKVNGQSLSLVIGGVRALNETNLYATKGSPEKFKVFIGFKVKVCTNLCVWSDGLLLDVKVSSLEGLKSAIYGLLVDYDHSQQLALLKGLNDIHITERQFAQVLGRGRMYHYLPKDMKEAIPSLEIGDAQLSMIAKGYYNDINFSGINETISLWNMYNLFTGAVKSSYINTFLHRNANCLDFIQQLKQCIDTNRSNWFLN